MSNFTVKNLFLSLLLFASAAFASDTTPFQATGNTVALDVTASSQSVQFPQAGTITTSNQVLVVNISANTVYVVFAGSSTAAVIPAPGTPANGIPIPAGAMATLTIPGGDPSGPWFSAIAAVAGPSRITVTPGSGS